MASRVSVASHVCGGSGVCGTSHVCGGSGVCGTSHVREASHVCVASCAPGICGASRLGLAVPRREPPVRAFGHGSQRITGVRGRGWCLIPAVPLNLQCRPGGPIMAPAASPAGARAPGPARAGGRPARRHSAAVLYGGKRAK